MVAALALEQTAGRGTNNRKWFAAAGNLTFSFTLSSGFPADQPVFSFAEASEFILSSPYMIGLAVYDSLEQILPPDFRDDLFLKWPNDILWNGKKIAGILIENEFKGDAVNMVIGIGVNIFSSPKIPGRQLTSIAEIGCPVVKAEELAKLILTECRKYFSIWKQKGFLEIRKMWLSRTCPIGTIMKIGTFDSCVEGVFLGIDDFGHIILKKIDGKIVHLAKLETQL